MEKIGKFFNMPILIWFKTLNAFSESRSIHRKYRDFFEIAASILELAKNTYVSRFFLVKNVGTNSRHIKKYLDILVQKGLLGISYKDGRVLYKTDEKGLIFLRHYSVLKEMLFGVGVNRSMLIAETTLPLKGERSAR